MGEDLHHKAPLFFLIAFGVFILIVVGIVFSLRPKSSSVAIPATNPVTESANPFKENSTIDNPFAATDSGKAEYKNPFEKLR